jgi:hypothetical protein
MTQSSLYHDPFAGVPPEQVIAPPEVVAAIEEQCSMPFAEAVEKYGGKPVPCPDGTYVAIANPAGCGREHFAAVAEVYRQLLERWGQQKRPRRVTEVKAVPRLDATPAKPRRQRQPSITTLIKRFGKTGKAVTSITLPDGTKLTFGEPEKSQDNPLDQWLAKKHARAPERH